MTSDKLKRVHRIIVSPEPPESDTLSILPQPYFTFVRNIPQLFFLSFKIHFIVYRYTEVCLYFIPCVSVRSYRFSSQRGPVRALQPRILALSSDESI